MIYTRVQIYICTASMPLFKDDFGQQLNGILQKLYMDHEKWIKGTLYDVIKI